MPLPHNKKITYEEFLEIANDVDYVEFIDGEVYYQATPTLEHQNIIVNMISQVRSFLKGKDCKAFVAPYDIIMKKEGEEKRRVQPDIFVLCGKVDMSRNETTKIPRLIIEILSPSNVWWDTSMKFNLYQRFGVEEYWMVKPKSKVVEVYNLDENGFYGEPDVYSHSDICKSDIFNDLEIPLKEIFD